MENNHNQISSMSEFMQNETPGIILRTANACLSDIHIHIYIAHIIYIIKQTLYSMPFIREYKIIFVI